MNTNFDMEEVWAQVALQNQRMLTDPECIQIMRDAGFSWPPMPGNPKPNEPIDHSWAIEEFGITSDFPIESLTD